MTIVKYLSPLVLAVGMSGQVLAQDEDGVGELEYLYGCAGCHGVFGEGDGPVSSMLNTAVPDLTMISDRNDGVFPYREVMQTIDGRAGTRHPGIMPVWGDKLDEEFGDTYGPMGAELMIRGRIMSLANYLLSIQK